MRIFTKKTLGLLAAFLALPFAGLQAQTGDYETTGVGESFTVPAALTFGAPVEFTAPESGILTVDVKGNLQSLSYHMPNGMGSILFYNAELTDAVPFYKDPAFGKGPWTYEYRVAEGTSYYFGLTGVTTYTVTLVSIEEEDLTGVESLVNDVENYTIYNLNGVKVNKDNLQKGIYIVNGKKYVVK